MSPKRIRLLTLNTHKGFSSFNRRFVLHDLRDAIRKVEADIVFLQEVLGEHGIHAPDRSQYEFLADEVWRDYAYGKNAIYPEGHHGNAILSKFPIRDFKKIDISTYSLETRGLLHCAIEVYENRLLHGICVHLGLFERHRREQLDSIADYIGKNIEPEASLIVAGDFNDWRMNAEERFAKNVLLKDAFQEAEGKIARSFPSFFPILPLDRVYARGLTAVSATVLSDSPWNRLSDHAGLLVELTF